MVYIVVTVILIRIKLSYFVHCTGKLILQDNIEINTTAHENVVVTTIAVWTVTTNKI